jgi:hypothetical protein
MVRGVKWIGRGRFAPLGDVINHRATAPQPLTRQSISSFTIIFEPPYCIRRRIPRSQLTISQSTPPSTKLAVIAAVGLLPVVVVVVVVVAVVVVVSSSLLRHKSK